VILKNLYLGGSAEAGNAWATRAAVTLSGMRTAGSVFAITDTLLGPLVLAYGRSGGNAWFYFFLNRPF
jgi:NTE family protein